MECKKILKLLDHTQNQPSTFTAIHWFETNHDSHRTYSTNSLIKFKTKMLRSSLRVYRDAYIVKGTITVLNKAKAVAPDNRINKYLSSI